MACNTFSSLSICVGTSPYKRLLQFNSHISDLPPVNDLLLFTFWLVAHGRLDYTIPKIELFSLFVQECLNILLSVFVVVGQRSHSLQKFVSSALNPHGESTQTLQAFATALSSYFKVSVTMQLYAMMITIMIIIIIIVIVIILSST